MRKLLITCLSLTLCCMGLLGLLSVRAAVNAVEPSGLIAEASALDALPTDTQPPGEKNPPLAPDIPLIDPDFSGQMLALTFDDGPSAENTPRLLDGLAARGARVTFFLVGARAEKMPELVLRAYEEGHALGGHSFDHQDRLTRLGNAALDKQVNTTAEIIGRITESAPAFLLRPPYGAIDQATALKTGKANMLWSIDPRDWDVRDAEAVRSHIVENAVDGGVVILHDIVSTTVDGVLLAIDDLQKQGWVFVTLPELYAAYEVPLVAGGIYHSPGNYRLP